MKARYCVLSGANQADPLDMRVMLGIKFEVWRWKWAYFKTWQRPHEPAWLRALEWVQYRGYLNRVGFMAHVWRR